MTVQQYKALEELLERAERITDQSVILTPHGREIQRTIRDLLVKVSAEQYRAKRRRTADDLLADSPV